MKHILICSAYLWSNGVCPKILTKCHFSEKDFYYVNQKSTFIIRYHENYLLTFTKRKL